MFSRLAKKVPSTTHASKFLSSFQSRYVHDIRVSLKLKCDNASNLSQRLQQHGATPVGEAVRRERVFYDRVPDAETLSALKVKHESDLSSEQIDSRSVAASAQMKGSNTKWYELSKSDSWLEKVDGNNWACRVPEKKPVTDESHLLVPRDRRVPKYRQLKGEKEIRRELNIQQDVTRPEQIRSLEEDLESRGIRPFTKIVTKESVFELENGAQLNVIETDFGYTYAKLNRLCINATIEDVKQAQNELAEMGSELDLSLSPYMLEDIEEFVRRFRPTLYDALVQSGVAARIQEQV